MLFSIKPARTILFILLFASIPFFIPRLCNVVRLKGQSYQEMLPNLHELVSFRARSAGAATLIPPTGATESTNSPPSSATDDEDLCAVRLVDDPIRALDRF